ncbi:hypothetical protein EMIT0111MI5_320019 [Burkholderia sp. IT-111MI5]
MRRPTKARCRATSRPGRYLAGASPKRRPAGLPAAAEPAPAPAPSRIKGTQDGPPAVFFSPRAVQARQMTS